MARVGEWLRGAVHELLWTRRLIDLLGASAVSSTRVFSCFFLGLALGAAVTPRLVHRLRRPWRAAALAEAGVAVLALPALFLPQWSGWIWPALGSERLIGWVGALVKLILSAAVVLPPAFCMGLVLPLMAAAVLRERHELRQHGIWLYAVNTLGGVLGLAFVTLVTLHRFGADGSMVFAIAVNLVVAAGCFVLDAAYDPEALAGKELSAKLPLAGRMPWPALVIAFASGMGILAFEVMALQLLGLSALLSFYAPMAVLSVVVLLLGTAALLVPLLLRRAGGPRRLLWEALLGTSVSMVVTPLWFFQLVQWVPLVPRATLTMFLATLASGLDRAMGPTMLLAGLVFPAVLAWLGEEGGDRYGRQWGWLLATNGVGGLLGTELAYGVIMPAVGVHCGIGSVAIFYGVVSLAWALLRDPEKAGTATAAGGRRQRNEDWPDARARAGHCLSRFASRVRVVLERREIHRVGCRYRSGRGSHLRTTLAIAPRESSGDYRPRRTNGPRGGRGRGGLGSHGLANCHVQPICAGRHGVPLRPGSSGTPAAGHAPQSAASGLCRTGNGDHSRGGAGTPRRGVAHSRRVVPVGGPGGGSLLSPVQSRHYAQRAVHHRSGRRPDLSRRIARQLSTSWSATCFYRGLRAKPGFMASSISAPYTTRCGREVLFCQWLAMYQLTPEHFDAIGATFGQVFPRAYLFRKHVRLPLSGAWPSWAFGTASLDWSTIRARCDAIRRSNEVLDPSVRHAEGVAMLYLGVIESSSWAGKATNTLSNMHVELAAGRNRVTGRPAAKYLDGEKWLRFADERGLRYLRRERVPGGAGQAGLAGAATGILGGRTLLLWPYIAGRPGRAANRSRGNPAEFPAGDAWRRRGGLVAVAGRRDAHSLRLPEVRHDRRDAASCHAGNPAL